MPIYNRDLLLYTTEGCNFKCPHCYNKINDSKKDILDLLKYEKITNFLDFLCDQNIIDRIMLTGGEPMMYKHLYELIKRYLPKKRISVFTNGSLLNESNSKLLKGVDVKISLHRLADGIDNIQEYIDMGKLLESEGINYGFIYTMNYKNFKYLFRAYKLFAENCRKSNFSFKFQPLVLFPGHISEKEYGLSNMTINDWDALGNIISDLIDFVGGDVSQGDNILYPIGSKNKKYFEMIRNMYTRNQHVTRCPTAPILTIAADGNVHPCMFLFDRTLGNINDLTDSRTSQDLLNNLGESEIQNIKAAKCVSNECIGACRPT